MTWFWCLYFRLSAYFTLLFWGLHCWLWASKYQRGSRFAVLSQVTFTCSKSTIKYYNMVWNMFKVNVVLVFLSFWCFYCSGVSRVSTVSLSNSNYFTSAKKCRRKSCIIDFTSAKMEFASAIFKKLYFSKYSIKRCCK